MIPLDLSQACIHVWDSTNWVAATYKIESNIRNGASKTFSHIYLHVHMDSVPLYFKPLADNCLWLYIILQGSLLTVHISAGEYY